MTTTKIYLETPDDIHGEIKKIQYERQIKGQKFSLKEIYYEMLKLGIEENKKASQK